MMDLNDFEEGLDRWGAAIARWPTEARHEAEALLATSAAARAARDGMAAVEAILVATMPGDIGAGCRFAAVATRSPQQRSLSPAGRRAGWGAAVAAALALGLVVGDVGRGAFHEDNPETVLASALDPATGVADVD